MPCRLVLPSPGQPLELQEYTPDAIKPGFVQVLVHATSLNHLDWKRIDGTLFIPSFPHVFGVDIAGTVLDPGNSSAWKAGDRIMSVGTVGWSSGCSYQTHVLVDERFAMRVPESITMEQASTIPFSLFTAACGLYLSLGLPREAPDTEIAVLIWGANGNVGSFATQLAKMSGYRVVAVTSSESSINKMRGLGADVVFSNEDPELVGKVRAAVEQVGGLKYAFDCVVTPDTLSGASKCMSVAEGLIATAIKFEGAPPQGRDGQSIPLKPVFSGAALGKKMGPGVDEEGLKLGLWLVESTPSLLETGKLKPLDLEVIGDLRSVSKGLDRLRKGKANAKLVVQV